MMVYPKTKAYETLSNDAVAVVLDATGTGSTERVVAMFYGGKVGGVEVVAKELADRFIEQSGSLALRMRAVAVQMSPGSEH